ncbi:MAG: hypothetical protein V8Q82_09570 [Christensenellales bacterium]
MKPLTWAARWPPWGLSSTPCCEKAWRNRQGNNITLQSAVAPRYTYTDADNIGLARDGVPSVLLELPLKYMHTSVETFDMHALTECARLLTAYCAAIDDSWRDELWN